MKQTAYVLFNKGENIYLRNYIKYQFTFQAVQLHNATMYKLEKDAIKVRHISTLVNYKVKQVNLTLL